MGGGFLKKSEDQLLKFLEQAFSAQRLSDYVVDLEYYVADETDQLAMDNPMLDDYIQDTIPDLTSVEYDDTEQEAWLNALRKIINHARTLIK